MRIVFSNASLHNGGSIVMYLEANIGIFAITPEHWISCRPVNANGTTRLLDKIIQ